MTHDDDLTPYHPLAAALVCAVRDRDAGTVAQMLTPLNTTDLYALTVLLAALVPDDRTFRQLLADGGVARDREGVPLRPEDWTADELREAHAAWNRRLRTPWSEAGEREYQRRRAVRRRARKAGTEGIDNHEGAAA